jgi:YggT family protein
MLVVFALARIIDFYILLIFVWTLGSWVPEWRYQEWYRTLSRIVEPYVNLFRGLRLQAGALDLTAMIAVLVLYLLKFALSTSGGLW